MADANVHFFHNFLGKAFNKEVDVNADSWYMMLLTSSASPDLSSWEYEDDLTNEVGAGGEYATGGKAMTNVTVTLIDDASAPAWAVGTAYKVGQLVRPTSPNGHVYRCIVAGASHAATEPTWPTDPGEDIVDNAATWEEAGAAYIKIDADDVVWEDSTITAAYGVVVDKTPASAASNPLMCLIDFGGSKSSTDGDFQVACDAVYGLGLIRVA